VFFKLIYFKKPFFWKNIMTISNKANQSPEQFEELIKSLKNRFEKNNIRHEGILWANVEAKLVQNTEKLWSLHEMERTGGEPDVVGYDKSTNEFIFFDCSADSPQRPEKHLL
jgi:hypothetical protein